MALTNADIQQIKHLIKNETAALQRQVIENDDWADGTYLVLQDLLLPLLKQNPQLAQDMREALLYRKQQFDQLKNPPYDPDEEPLQAGQMEAGAKLYDYLQQLKAFPEP